MKIVYIANARIPTEKAHGLQIVKTCEALAQAGQEVILIIPRRKNHLTTDPFDFYQVKNNFKIIKISCLDIVSWGRWGFWLESLSFGLGALVHTWSWPAEIFFSRDELILWLLGVKKRKLFWEVHDGRINLLIRRILPHLTGIIAITANLKNYYQQKGFSDAKIFVVPDAVDLKKFSLSISREEARRKLGLPNDKKLIIYTGHLYPWKGVDTLAQAARLLPQNNFLFVGGTDQDVENFKSKYKVFNISILGHQPHEDIPYFLKAADLLVLPNSGREAISRLYTSPMKLFEYMSSGTPIISSSLPSLREILNEENSKLIEPDSSKNLAQAIDELLADDKKAKALAVQARLDVREYSWAKRAAKLVSFFEQRKLP